MAWMAGWPPNAILNKEAIQASGFRHPLFARAAEAGAFDTGENGVVGLDVTFPFPDLRSGGEHSHAGDERERL